MSSILFVRTQAEAEAESTREVGRIRTDNAADSKCHLNFPRDCRQIYRECDWWGAWSPFGCESRCAIRGPSTTDMGRGLTKELVGLFKQGQASFGSDRSNQYNKPSRFSQLYGDHCGNQAGSPPKPIAMSPEIMSDRSSLDS